MTLAIHPPIYPHATPRKEQRSPTPSFQIEEKIQEIYASCIEQLSQTFTTPQLFPPFQKEHTILEELNYHTMIHPEVLFSTIASQFCTFLHYSQYFVIPIFSHNANFIERGKKYNYHIIIYRTTPYARQYDILIGNSANTIPINSSRIKKIYKGLHCTYSLDPNPRISSFQMIVFQILHNNKLIFDQRLQTSLFHRMVFEIIKTGIAIPSTMIEPLIWIQPYYEKTLTDFVNSILEGDRFPDFVTNINIFSSLLEIMNAHRFFNLHHDDLKPDNLLMRGRASPVINDYDFGFQGSSCIPDPIVAQNPRDYPFWPATRNYGYKTSFTDTYSLFLPILHFLITYDLNYYEYYKQLHKIIHLKNPDRYLALLKLSCITNFSQMFNHHKEKDT
ncbi:MAG TPA: hypothetical protein P5048_02345 [Chlamydiales bacterium]|nr:hypothetical protein [Chlamydiales bacterium]